MEKENVEQEKNATQNEDFAVVRVPDGKGGHEHKLMPQSEAETLVKTEPFHYVEWSGSRTQILEEANTRVFVNHYEFIKDWPHDEGVTLGHLADEADILTEQESDMVFNQYKDMAMLDARKYLENVYPESWISLSDPDSSDPALSVTIDSKDTRVAPVIKYLPVESQRFAFVPRDVVTIDSLADSYKGLVNDWAASNPDKVNKSITPIYDYDFAFLDFRDALMFEQIAQFENSTDIALGIKDGRPFHNGDLVLEGGGPVVIPDNLHVGGDLDIRDSSINHLPHGLKVEGNLYLMGSKVESLPADLKVKTLWLQDGRHTLNHSPRTPDGYIDLRAAGVPIDKPRMNEAELSPLIKRQMADFEASTGIQLSNKDGHPYYNGNLDLRESRIETLPLGLEVNGSLDLHSSRVKTLPENLVVNGFLDLSFTRVRELPQNFTVGGGLGLAYSSVAKLPDNLHVKKWLDIEGTNMKELPHGLTVNAAMYMEGSKVDRLPRDLRVGQLYMDNLSVEATHETMTRDGFIDFNKVDVPLVELPREELSPLMQQYVDFKQKYPNMVPLFRFGNNYETYYKDADRVAKALNLPVQTSATHIAPDGYPARFISEDQHNYWKLNSMLVANRIPFLVLEDMNKVKTMGDVGERGLSSEVHREAVREQSSERYSGFRR